VYEGELEHVTSLVRLGAAAMPDVITTFSVLGLNETAGEFVYAAVGEIVADKTTLEERQRIVGLSNLKIPLEIAARTFPSAD
jgi:hypothetical protein